MRQTDQSHPGGGINMMMVKRNTVEACSPTKTADVEHAVYYTIETGLN